MSDGEADYRGYSIKYPSGNEFTLTGKFQIVSGPQHEHDVRFLPVILRGDKNVVLDQRAIVTDKVTGEVVYTPRRMLLALTEDIRKWCDGHPEWGSTQGDGR